MPIKPVVNKRINIFIKALTYSSVICTSEPVEYAPVGEKQIKDLAQRYDINFVLREKYNRTITGHIKN